jgi:hypothetical protein
MNRSIFFDSIRKSLFGGSLGQPTVDGITAILDAWDRSGFTDLRYLAYMLATVQGEVGVNMQPVREGFKATDADARAYVKRQGYRYAVVINGRVYYGRGLVQLTWDYNYRKAGQKLGIDLLGSPDLALRPDIAAKIMILGMTEGWFTGKKLSDYFTATKTDWINARRIINGTDRAAEFAGFARDFYGALVAANGEPLTPQPDDPGPSPDPIPDSAIPG